MIFLDSKSSKMQSLGIITLKYFLSIQENEMNLHLWVLTIVASLGLLRMSFSGIEVTSV